MAFSQFTSFDELPPHVVSLFANAADDSFFQGLPWFQLFARYALDKGDRIRIFCSDRSTQPTVPLAALAAVEHANAKGIGRPRKLSSLSNYYSCLYAPVSRGLDWQEAAGEIATAIAKDKPAWDIVDLKPLDVSSPAFSALESAFNSAGFVVQRYFCFGNWYLEINGRSFVQYFESLPSVLKNTVTRKRKKMDKSGRAILQIVTGGSELESAIKAYNDVYAESWKRPEPYPHFIPELMRMCAGWGGLRLGLIHVDGIPVAAQFWIVHNGVALIYKLAYNERYKDLSAGSILTTALMQHVIDVDRVREVDYLTGDDAYKRDWMSGRRERWGILAMNPRTFHGAAAIVRHVGGRVLKRTICSIRERLPKFQRASQVV